MGEVPRMEEERTRRVLRYREKRLTRLFSNKIRYQVRKLNAQKRPRIKVTHFTKCFIPNPNKTLILAFILFFLFWLTGAFCEDCLATKFKISHPKEKSILFFFSSPFSLWICFLSSFILCMKISQNLIHFFDTHNSFPVAFNVVDPPDPNLPLKTRSGLTIYSYHSLCKHIYIYIIAIGLQI